MTIDRINPLEPIQPGKKPGRSGQTEKSANTDSITLSSEAVEKAELYKALEIVAVSEDVRIDRVAELKAKINDPTYLKEATKATADRLIDIFGL